MYDNSSFPTFSLKLICILGFKFPSFCFGNLIGKGCYLVFVLFCIFLITNIFSYVYWPFRFLNLMGVNSQGRLSLPPAPRLVLFFLITLKQHCSFLEFWLWVRDLPWESPPEAAFRRTVACHHQTACPDHRGLADTFRVKARFTAYLSLGVSLPC